MNKLLDKLLNTSVEFCKSALVALIVLIIGLKIIKMLDKALRKEHKFTTLDASSKSFVISLITASLKVLLFVSIATILGFPTTSLVTIIGSCALAIGLALQGGLSNLAGGLMIVIFKPFKVGDYISTHTDEGTVKNISIFYTTLTTPDNKEIMLPNGNLSNSSLINYTANKKRRIDLDISVSYSSDIEKVKKTILSVVKKNKLILDDEEIFIRLTSLGDSALVFTLRVWAETPNYFTVLYDLKENIKISFDKNKIEIPYSQLDVRLLK